MSLATALLVAASLAAAARAATGAPEPWGWGLLVVVLALAVVSLRGRGRAPFRAAIGDRAGRRGPGGARMSGPTDHRTPRPRGGRCRSGRGGDRAGRAGRRPEPVGAAAGPRRLPPRQVLRRRRRPARARPARRRRRHRSARRPRPGHPAAAEPRRPRRRPGDGPPGVRRAAARPRRPSGRRRARGRRAAGAPPGPGRRRRGPRRHRSTATVSGRVVVGADGAHSVVRRAVGRAGRRPGRWRSVATRRPRRSGTAPRSSPSATPGSRRTPGPSTAATARSNVGYGELLTARRAPPTRTQLLEQLDRLLPGATRDAGRLARPPPAAVDVAPAAPGPRAGAAGRRRRRAGQPDDRRGHLLRRRHRARSPAGRPPRPRWRPTADAATAARATYTRRVRGLLGPPPAAHRARRARLSLHDRVLDAGLRASARDQRVFDDLVELGLARGTDHPDPRPGPRRPRSAEPSRPRPSARPPTGDTRMRILSVAGVLPEHRYPQEQITEIFTTTMLRGAVDLEVVERLHAQRRRRAPRHLALPLERYAELADFGESNDAFIEVGVELGARAVTDALKAADLTPAGRRPHRLRDRHRARRARRSTPGSPALIGLRPDVVRVPIVGLGCVAGAAGVARLHDYLVGHPDKVAVLMSVELCSLTLQRDDTSMANLVASGLFGDGAAAVVAVGRDRAADLAAEDAPGSRASPTCWPAAAGSTPTPSARWAGTSAPAGSRSCSTARCPRWSPATSAATSPRSSPTTGSARPTSSGTSPTRAVRRCSRPCRRPSASRRRRSRSRGTPWPPIGNLSSASVLHVLADTLADPAAAARLLRAHARDGAGLLLRAGAAAGPGARRMSPRSCSRSWSWRSASSGSPSSWSPSATPRGASSAGGVETGRGHYPSMVVLHTGLLVGLLVEVWLRRPDFVPAAGLHDARPRRRLAGAALVVHRARSGAAGTPASSSCRGSRR